MPRTWLHPVALWLGPVTSDSLQNLRSVYAVQNRVYPCQAVARISRGEGNRAVNDMPEARRLNPTLTPRFRSSIVDSAGKRFSAQEEQSYRKGLWEIILSPQYTLAKNLGFDGGTTAKIEDTWGFGLQIGYNFNDHWNLAGLFSGVSPITTLSSSQLPAILCRPEIPAGRSK